MASITHTLPIRSSNKEPEWLGSCVDVFQQYLDADPFDFSDNVHEQSRSSSDESLSNLFDDISGSSSNGLSASSCSGAKAAATADTSPIPSYALDGADVHWPLPQAIVGEEEDFWTKTLRALEQNAAETSIANPHGLPVATNADFLSLGGCPSPHLPSSPTLPSSAAGSFRSRPRIAANGSKSPTKARSISRGRLVGITKPSAASVRKPSASLPKMMNPSRYRAGFQDVWKERIAESAEKYQLRVPPQGKPASPPPSANFDGFAGFGRPMQVTNGFALTAESGLFDDQFSPLADTFRRARLYTPTASPLVSPNSNPRNSYFEPAPPLPPNPYATQAYSLNDTTPIWPDCLSSLATDAIENFDFGFNDAALTSAPAYEPVIGAYTPISTEDIFAPPSLPLSMASSSSNVANSGLMISCKPALVSRPTSMHYTEPAQMYVIPSIEPVPYYLPVSNHRTVSTAPSTPHAHRRRASSPPPSSPGSPQLASARARSRSRHASSSYRRASRHRRAKSSTSQASPKKAGMDGGFVNFTPDDSGRILNGVAPSGSSKTKARREKEAQDKRRQLSQAAIRAVVEAGGDVTRLRRAGLDI